MEHNIEKLIREKVKKAEQQPVIWQKENVWLAIENTFEARQRNSLFYYVAASVLLAVSMLTFLMEPKTNYGSFQNSSLAKKGVIRHTDKDDGSKFTLAEKCESFISSKYILSKNSIKPNKIINSKTPTTSSLPTETITPTIENHSPEVSDNKETVVIKIEPVHAIFGVEEKPIELISKREKKVRFRFFRTEEEASPIINTSEPANLLARINKN